MTSLISLLISKGEYKDQHAFHEVSEFHYRASRMTDCTKFTKSKNKRLQAMAGLCTPFKLYFLLGLFFVMFVEKLMNAR